jgi:hypothetical protein
MIYFAKNGRWTSNVKGSWTAISRAPYLKALCLFAKGDCWHGGGLFQTSTEYWLNDGCGHELQREDVRLRRIGAYPWHERYGGECRGVYFIRLQRDGWQLTRSSPDGRGGEISLFEKRINNHWLLRKHAHATLPHSVGRGAYYDTHELFNARTLQSLQYERWEWAEVDRDRIVWASEGCLHAGRVDANGLQASTQLHDFGPMRFERVTAPY